LKTEHTYKLTEIEEFGKREERGVRAPSDGLPGVSKLSG
jgi:hypothetical protein